MNEVAAGLHRVMKQGLWIHNRLYRLYPDPSYFSKFLDLGMLGGSDSDPPLPPLSHSGFGALLGR